MPIHDWTRVDAGLFHDFHQSWSIALRTSGLLSCTIATGPSRVTRTVCMGRSVPEVSRGPRRSSPAAAGPAGVRPTEATP